MLVPMITSFQGYNNNNNRLLFGRIQSQVRYPNSRFGQWYHHHHHHDDIMKKKKKKAFSFFMNDSLYSTTSSSSRSSTMISLKDENKIDEDGSINVTFETCSNTKTIVVKKGEILRSALLKRGISPHNGRSRLINCRGLGTCGTCAVEIYNNSTNNCDDDDDSVMEPVERNTKEQLRLKFPPHGSKDQSSHLRLACQVQINGDVTVKKRTGFWGQDTTNQLAEEYESQLWFGDYEYILDDKSPPTTKDN